MPDKSDGVNLTPYLNGEKTTAPHESLFFAIGGIGAVRKGPWKLVLPLGKDPQLFDVEKDVGETQDLAANHKEKINELHEQWKAWFAQMPAVKKGKKAE